jgi:HlyD family secretion protein
VKRTRIAAVALLALACGGEAPVQLYQAIPVARRSITVAVRAAGMVQPDTVVEVKSKASGEILEMRAETGQLVSRGELLVRVDQRAPRNELSQAEANLEVARARFINAEAQKRRSDELFRSQSITEQELESASLNLANARAEVIGAEVAVESARIAMDDTDVRAPITGTVISKNVERGQVISSPTRDVGGGTVLLKMADLNLVQVRTLVDEVDIGKIQPGLQARVTVDAYPNQPFQGQVLKIEPQAETQQNVTMFPVIVRIPNRNGLLKPGMNADVQIQVGQRDSVLAVPNSALRTQRDVASAGQVLGISEDRLRAMLAQADTRRDSARTSALGDTAQTRPAAQAAAGNTMTLPDGRTVTLPAGVTEAQARELMRKRFSGGQLTQQEQATVQQLMRSFGAGGGNAGGRPRQQGAEYQFGGDYIVFVMRDGQPTPMHVRTGLTDLDYAEVVSGLTDTDSVVILPSASLVASQEEFRNRINQMTGQGVPGMRQNQTPTQPTRQATPTGGGRS